MATESIQAKLTGTEPVSVQFDIDDTLEGAVKRYGEDIVYSRYRAQLVIDLQAYIRSLIRADRNIEDIQQAVDQWAPGIKARGKTAAEKARDIFARLSEEERAQLLDELGLS